MNVLAKWPQNIIILVGKDEDVNGVTADEILKKSYCYENSILCYEDSIIDKK